MSERSRLANGRFLNRLDNWTAGGGATYSPGDGDDHYGVAVLPTGGGSISQAFTVPQLRSYSLYLAAKPAGAALTAGQLTVAITDGEGEAVTTKEPAGSADVWSEATYEIGLAPGTTYTLTITNASATGDVKIDDLWLWFVPITRAAMAARIHAKLGRLATQRSLSTSPDGALSEGDYTYSIEAGLRAAGALNPETGLVDVRYLDAEVVQTALDLAEREILEQLQRDYAVDVDVQIGPRRENLSQVTQALEALTGTARWRSSAGGPVTMRKLKRSAEDYEFND